MRGVQQRELSPISKEGLARYEHVQYHANADEYEGGNGRYKQIHGQAVRRVQAQRQVQRAACLSQTSAAQAKCRTTDEGAQDEPVDAGGCRLGQRVLAGDGDADEGVRGERGVHAERAAPAEKPEHEYEQRRQGLHGADFAQAEAPQHVSGQRSSTSQDQDFQLHRRVGLARGVHERAALRDLQPRRVQLVHELARPQAHRR